MSSSMIIAVYMIALFSRGDADKPQIRSTETTMDFYAEEDFQFNFQNSASSMKLSDIQSVKKMVDDAQARVIGVCANGSAINSITVSGNVLCTKTIDETVRAKLEADITTLSLAIPRKCRFSDWSPWSQCFSGCGATQTRTRTVIQAASASAMLCVEFPLEEERGCNNTWKCRNDDPDFCNGNERWYYLNSGPTDAHIASYADQDVVFYRGGGAFPYGKLAREMFAGEVFSLNAVSSGVAAFQPGDYLCGRSGDINVLGTADNGHRSWVPDRLQGTEFLVPIIRGDSQLIYVLALHAQAVVSLYLDSTKVEELYVPAGGVHFFIMNIAQPAKRVFYLNSTSPILVSYVAGVIGVPDSVTTFTGSVDYMPIPPIAPIVYGIPSMGYAVSIVADQLVSLCSDASSQTIVSRGAVLLSSNSIDRSATNYSGPCCRLESTSGGQVAAASINDRDGEKSTMWLSPNLMGKLFLITQVVQFIAVSCTGPGSITFQSVFGNTGGQVRDVLSGRGPGPRTYRMEQPKFLRPGVFVKTSVSCFLVTDNQGSQDETIIFGSG
eukprot:m.137672 g.137672  ORF g.137672 m.137672 type:complete len:552 (-) comp29936_c0_seq2:21-1676(-)